MRPVFADLQWQDEGGRCIAPATPIWWIYWRAEKDLLKNLGFSCFADGPWFVEFKPRLPEDTLIDEFATLEQRHAADVAAEREAVAKRLERQAVYEAELRERNERLARQRTEASDAAKARGRACFDEWGQFTESKPTLMRLLGKDQLTHNDIRKVDQIVTATKRKGVFKLLEIECAPVTGVDWPEETVEGALRYLTGLDDDWAQVKNGAGWSASSTSLGHWCVRQLDHGDASARALGIKAGRQLLRGYTAQLHDFLHHQGFDRCSARGKRPTSSPRPRPTWPGRRTTTTRGLMPFPPAKER